MVRVLADITIEPFCSLSQYTVETWHMVPETGHPINTLNPIPKMPYIH